MTLSLWYTSAHYRLRAEYGRHLIIATAAARALVWFGAALSPPYIPAPHTLPASPVKPWIPFVVQYRIPEPPPDLQPSTGAGSGAPIINVDPVPDPPSIVDPRGLFEPPNVIVRGPQEFPLLPEIPPTFVCGPQAEYPDFARRAGAEGQVLVLVVIGCEGRVVRASIHDSNTIAVLEDAALEAARKYLFKPGTQRGVPVECQAIIPFDFTID